MDSSQIWQNDHCMVKYWQKTYIGIFVIIWKCQKRIKKIPYLECQKLTNTAIFKMSEKDKEFHLQYYSHFNIISVILGLWEGDFEFKGCVQ